MEQHFHQMFGQTINMDVEYGAYGPNPTGAVSKDLDELLAMQSGADKRLSNFLASRAI